MTSSPLGARRGVALAVLAAALAAGALACGSDSRPQRAARTGGPRGRGCGEPGDAQLAAAVLKYVELARPTPQRFLVAAGTDSALPEAGLLALQRKGPTYLFPADAKQQTALRARLAQVGSYNTLLVVLKERRLLDPAQMLYRMSGTYVGGPPDGQTAGVRALVFRCDSTGWRLSSSDSEQTT
ncbi:MAG TPA: hypothetical protein VNA89_05330 [Gemmatimonadaceae bacterium]|nr:hypothetical protein [Gemmatimonadaceae bacterium]